MMPVVLAYLPWLAVTVGLWLSQWLVRKRWPDVWEKFADFGPGGLMARKVWQGLPSVLAGALIGAAQSGGDPMTAAIGALAGALAPLKHEFMKAASWIPYDGK